MSAPDQVELLKSFLDRHPRLFVLTGAGCSTPSGIPDYRDRKGQWKRPEPVRHQDFLKDELVRARYWARSMIGWPHVESARPNAAHHALADWQASGRLECLMTQNVDGLHQKAGCTNVIDLHGRIDTVTCMSCQASSRRDALQRRLEAENAQFSRLEAQLAPDGDADLDHFEFEHFVIPACESCGGMLKPDVVFFGANVPQSRVSIAMHALEMADALLIVGSSLMVYSGYRFAVRAHALGKPIVAVNLGQTRADPILQLKLEADCAALLPKMDERLLTRRGDQRSVDNPQPGKLSSTS